MRLRRLGSSSLEISVIGIGSWVFGGTKRSWGWGPQDDAESVATIMRAVDLGINCIDNALSYGFGHSDEIVAREFHGRRLAANMALTEALAPVADRHSTAITSVALSWTLAFEGVTTVLAGARRPEQIDGWADAAELVLNLATWRKSHLLLSAAPLVTAPPGCDRSFSQERKNMSGPLHGVRVLDVTSTFSGPVCTQILGDFGADVIKVEPPAGDITRALGTVGRPGMGSVFVGSNRNKASLVLDLKTERGWLRFRELATRADVLVHNMRLRAARALGIDYESLREDCPNLVYCSITGFGSKGPYNDRPAYDDIIQAESGLVWLQSLGSDSPRYVATAIADKTAGMTAANAVMAALVHRSQSGCGQHVEVPMFETLAAYVLLEQLGGRAFVPSLGPTGYSRMRSVHRRPYETMDGFISVVVYNEGHWRRFLAHVGHGDLLDTERFGTVASRNTHIDELYELLANVLTERTTDEWLTIFETLDIPAGRVVSPDDLFDDQHLNAVDFFLQTGAGDAQFVAPRSPVIFSATPVHYGSEATPPPALGSGESAAKRWLAP